MSDLSTCTVPAKWRQGAIHNFIVKALANEKIAIHGDGSQIRAWCYIDDQVEAVRLCLKKQEAIGNVFNVGDPRGTITIYNLAREIIRLAGSKSEIIFAPLTYTDIEVRVPNIDRIRYVLGFEPRTTLEEGLIKTINWYRNNS